MLAEKSKKGEKKVKKIKRKKRRSVKSLQRLDGDRGFGERGSRAWLLKGSVSLTFRLDKLRVVRVQCTYKIYMRKGREKRSEKRVIKEPTIGRERERERERRREASRYTNRW